MTFSGPNSPFSWRNGNSPAFNDAENNLTIEDNLQYTRGKHSMTVGGMIQRLQTNYKAQTRHLCAMDLRQHGDRRLRRDWNQPVEQWQLLRQLPAGSFGFRQRDRRLGCRDRRPLAKLLLVGGRQDQAYAPRDARMWGCVTTSAGPGWKWGTACLTSTLRFPTRRSADIPAPCSSRLRAGQLPVPG